jgi:toxin FitB
MRRDPHPAVLAWVAAQPRALLYTTFINQVESSTASEPCRKDGGARLWQRPPKRSSRRDFAGRILPFEAAAAARYPSVVLARRQAGTPIEKFDALIAATALAAGASIATRDTGGFTGCGLTVINPWVES